MINCSMQTSLLPAELQSLSCLMTILNLLQCDPYPRLAKFSRPRVSAGGQNSDPHPSKGYQGLPNWRELVPGHVIYRQVLPNCMSTASEYVQLPVFSPLGRVSRRVKVEGAVGYALQWMQPPHIPVTHLLRITAYVYSYSPSAIQANMAARQTHSRHVLSTNKEEAPHKDKIYLKKEVLCELHGCSTEQVFVRDKLFHKQTPAICSDILLAAATNLFNYQPPSLAGRDARTSEPFYIGDMVIRAQHVTTAAAAGDADEAVESLLEQAEQEAPGEIGDVCDIRGPYSTDPTVNDALPPLPSLSAATPGIGRVYEVCVRWRDGGQRDIYIVPERDIKAGSSEKAAAPVTSSTLLPTATSSLTDPAPEIILWRANTMARVQGSLEAVKSTAGTGFDIFDSHNYLWTPLLTRELEIELVPIDSSLAPNTSRSAKGAEGVNEQYNGCTMDGYASLLVTPILSPSSVVHSASYQAQVEGIVNHFALLPTLKGHEYSTAAVLAATISRDQVDSSLISLVELTLKQR